MPTTKTNPDSAANNAAAAAKVKKPHLSEGEPFYKDEKTALFIDGANLYGATRALEFDVDFRKMRSLFADVSRLVRAYYYTALPDEANYSPVRPLVDWLQYNGFCIVKKPMKAYVGPDGQRRFKGNMDVEIAVDVMKMAPWIQHAIIVSGDGDFRYLVEALQQLGIRVTILSTMQSQPPMLSDDLRRQADHFLELVDLRDVIARPHLPRPHQDGASATDGSPSFGDGDYPMDSDEAGAQQEPHFQERGGGGFRRQERS